MNERTKELLEKQLELLSEQSEKCTPDELSRISLSMVETAGLIVNQQNEMSFSKVISDSKLPLELKKELGKAATNLELCTTDVLILVAQILHSAHLL